MDLLDKMVLPDSNQKEIKLNSIGNVRCENCKFWELHQPPPEDQETEKLGFCYHPNSPKFVFLCSFGCVDDGKNLVLFPAEFGCRNFNQSQKV